MPIKPHLIELKYIFHSAELDICGSKSKGFIFCGPDIAFPKAIKLHAPENFLKYVTGASDFI